MKYILREIFSLRVLIIIGLLVRIYSLNGDIALLRHDVDLLTKDVNSANIRAQECDDDNYTLNEKIRYTQGQNDYMLDRCEALYRQLRKTTDVLEHTIFCRYDKGTLSSCVGEDLPQLIHDNRKANF